MVHYISKQISIKQVLQLSQLVAVGWKVCMAFIQNQDRRSQTGNIVHRLCWDRSGSRRSNAAASSEKSVQGYLDTCAVHKSFINRHNIEINVSSRPTYSQKGPAEIETTLLAPPVVSQLFWTQAEVHAAREPGLSWLHQCPAIPESVTHI
jgi:hypothetical protein